MNPIIKVSQGTLSSNPIQPLVDTTQAGFASIAPGDPLQVLKGDGGWNYRVPWQRYNAIRNPEMIVTQRGVGPSALKAGSGFNYGVDGWAPGLFFSGSGPGWAGTWSQIAAAIPPDTSGNNWYPYIPYALRLTITTGNASLSAGSYFNLTQRVEGVMAEKLKNNPTSISFLVRSNITGTFTVALQDPAGTAAYLVPATISQANVWTRIAIPNIPPFTIGTFADGTGECYHFSLGLGYGSTYTSPTANTWIAGNYGCLTGMTNFGATTGTTFDFTLVQHEPNPVCTPYIRRELVTETALNYRYLWVLPASIWVGWLGGNPNWTAEFNRFNFPYPMRGNPTLLSGCSFAVATGNAGTPGMGVSSPTMANIENTGAAWTASAYNTNWAQLANGGFTAEL